MTFSAYDKLIIFRNNKDKKMCIDATTEMPLSQQGITEQALLESVMTDHVVLPKKLLKQNKSSNGSSLEIMICVQPGWT